MRNFGVWVLCAGLAGMVLAFFYPVGAYDFDLHSTIANADRMAIRAMLHLTAGFVAVVGALIAVGGALLEGIAYSAGLQAKASAADSIG